jgi:Secretion system C-terminal sorting domain
MNSTRIRYIIKFIVEEKHMTLRFTIAMLLMGSTMFASMVFAHTKHIVEVSDEVFTPVNLTIEEVSDTVHWANTGGNQNVNAGNEANVNTFELMQNFPNPFNPSTQIEFTLEESGQVTLKVFNLLGKEVSTLVDSKLSAGIHSVNFDGSNLNSGVYLYTIKTDNFIRTKKMILMK